MKSPLSSTHTLEVSVIIVKNLILGVKTQKCKQCVTERSVHANNNKIPRCSPKYTYEGVCSLPGVCVCVKCRLLSRAHKVALMGVENVGRRALPGQPWLSISLLFKEQVL